MKLTEPIRLSRSTRVAIFAVIALLIAGCGYIYYQKEILPVRFSNMADLKAVADLKVAQIELWQHERLADARMNSSGIIREYVSLWSRDWKNDSRKKEIASRMRFFQENEGYQNIILADTEGRIRVSLNSGLTDLEPEAKRLVAQAISLKHPVPGDFFLCLAHRHEQIHVDVAAPVLNAQDQPIAVLILRTDLADPDRYFFPLTQPWSASFKSFEILLSQIDGDQIQLLNILRQRPDSPFNMRLPISESGLQEFLTTCGKAGECT